MDQLNKVIQAQEARQRAAAAKVEQAETYLQELKRSHSQILVSECKKALLDVNDLEESYEIAKKLVFALKDLI